MTNNHIHEAAHRLVAEKLGYVVLEHTVHRVHVVPLPEGRDWVLFNWAGVIADVVIQRQKWSFGALDFLMMFLSQRGVPSKLGADRPYGDPDDVRLLRAFDRDPREFFETFRITRKLLMRHWDEVLDASMRTALQ